MAKDQVPVVTSICVIGGGYVGGPTAAIIANKCPHIQVTVVDRNSDRISAWRSDQLPVSEPNLLDIVRVPRDGLRLDQSKNLTFTTKSAESIQAADMVIIAIDTPTKVDGEGAGFLLDITGIEEVAKSIARVSTRNKIVVEKSTVPVGTGQRVRGILQGEGRDGVRFEVLSNPEFLAEGTAVHNLLFPDRVIIGSSEERTGLLAAEALANVYGTWVPRQRIIFSNLFSSELSKLGANALLAQRVSSINALSVMCEATGADIEQIARAVGSDSRIGPHMLRSSFGFGGSCFLKDIRSMIYLCQALHLPEVAAYWKSILDLNDMQKSRVIPRITSLIGGNIKGKKIAILGFAFKKDTADTRESCAIDLIKDLVRAGASVSVYDPRVADDQIRRDLDLHEDDREHRGTRTRICKSAQEACEGSCAVVVATDWDMFQVNPQRRILGSASVVASPDDNHIRTPTPNPFSCVAALRKMSRRLFGLDQVSYSQEIEILYKLRTQSATSSERFGQGMERDNLVDSLNWKHVVDIMEHPKLVLGSTQILDRAMLEEMGFLTEIIGSKRHAGASRRQRGSVA